MEDNRSSSPAQGSEQVNGGTPEAAPPLAPVEVVPTQAPPPYSGSSDLANHSYQHPHMPDHLTDAHPGLAARQRMNGIITIDGHSTRPSQTNHDKFMSFSLCLMMVCMFINPLSLMFTLPAVVLAWKAVMATNNSDFKSAEKNHQATVYCMYLLVLQAVIIVCVLVFGVVLVVLYFTGHLR